MVLDYRKTLYDLTKEELIQIIIDLLDKGGYVSRKIQP